MFNKLISLADQDSDLINLTNTDPTYVPLQNLRPSMYSATGVNLLLGIAGVLSFIYLLWGGVQWITAGSDKEGVEKARRRIMHALIGLSVVFSAYAILYALRVLFNVNIIGVNISQIGT